MLLLEYFQSLRLAIEDCTWVQNSSVTYDQRSTLQGFVRGELYFVDGSMLHFREYIDADVTIDRFVYAYQYMNAHRTLIFRYDNADHHPQVASHPHHKHDGSETNIVESTAPTLESVLAEIEQLIDIV